MLPVCADAQEPSQLDGNETMFTVLAAINAAGFDADLASPANHPLRKMLRDYLAKQDIPVMADLKKFYAEHRQKDAKADLNQYISYALCVHAAPDFRFRFKMGDLPPEVVPLDGFGDLLTAFYKQAKIPELWAKSQPAYDQMIATYQPLVAQGLVQANAYLRNPTSGAPRPPVPGDCRPAGASQPDPGAQLPGRLFRGGDAVGGTAGRRGPALLPALPARPDDLPQRRGNSTSAGR